MLFDEILGKQSLSSVKTGQSLLPFPEPECFQEPLRLVTHSFWHLLIKAGLAQVTDRLVQ